MATPSRRQSIRAGSLATAITVIIVSAHAALTPAAAASLAETFKPRANASGTLDHSEWTALLGSYVVASPDGINRVRYGTWKREAQPALKSYIAKLEAVDPVKLAKPEQFAYWANLYNAKTVDVVLDAYPVASIKDIRLGGGLFGAFASGPWKAKVLTVSGQSLSLDDIEHEILRPIFRDARIHYAVNCASIGCPNLSQVAFSGAALEPQLDAAARDYINHPRGISARSGSVSASSIFSWYKIDFGNSDIGVLRHAKRYANDSLKGALANASDIANFDYDWSLNDAGD